jgi:hypothetical protein
MPTKVKVSGAWKDVSKVHAKVSGAWKEVNGVYVRVSGVLKQVYQGITLPTGLIIPYYGGSAPSGWSLFASANDKYIIGAGTKAVGATGGSITVDGTTITIGNHLGDAAQYSTFGESGVLHGYTTEGNHAHTFSFTYAPNKRKLVLIKAGAGLSQLPANGIILTAEQAMAGLTQLFDSENRYLVAASAVGTEDDSTSKNVSSSTNGAHTHGSGTRWFATNEQGGEYDKPLHISAGGHSHTVNVTSISANLLRVYLNAFYHASQAYDLADKMIGLWESLTPPQNWVLCDGNNGTPNLNDAVAMFGPKASGGSRTGDNTLSYNYSAAAEAGHIHDGSTVYNSGFGTSYHPNSISMGAHSGSGSPAFAPPYYALAFIMFKPN